MWLCTYLCSALLAHPPKEVAEPRLCSSSSTSFALRGELSWALFDLFVLLILLGCVWRLSVYGMLCERPE